jgi:hypothetical protein
VLTGSKAIELRRTCTYMSAEYERSAVLGEGKKLMGRVPLSVLRDP